MSVNVDQLDLDVSAQAGAPAPAASPAPHADEQMRLMREMRAQLARDAARTRAEGFDD